MNALINLKDCREYMTITLNNKDHRIKLSGTIDDPYFCGRNVCNILGYKNPKDAIQRYVEKEDKKDLKQLQTFNGSDEPNKLGGSSSPQLVRFIRTIKLPRRQGNLHQRRRITLSN